ncbi:MAG: AI-2E family transporter [Ruminococcaceae bacterium]|nr:AI-2E family transporter [Oscillospiraceae bacterium]
MNTVKKTIIFGTLTALGALLIIYYRGIFENFIIRLWNAINPVLIGFFIAYIINILMSRYEKLYFPSKNHLPIIQKTRRPVCLVASLLTLCGIITLVMILVIPELISCIKLLVSEIPLIIDDIMENEKLLNAMPESISSALSEIDMTELTGKIAEKLFSGIGTAAETIFYAVSAFISSVISLLISIVFSVYILLKKEKLAFQFKAVLRNYLPQKITDKILYAASVLNESFHGFIVGQCLEAVILGFLCIIGMYIFRFPYAAMIGTLIGFTALIPVAGAFIGAGIGAIMILTVSPVKSLFFILFIIVLQQFEENVIYPKVVGKKIGLPSFYVLTAITVGGGLFGITGMLLFVPLFSAIYKIIQKDISQKSRDI